MARIAGVDLPREKRSDIGLTYVLGLAGRQPVYILGKAGIDGADPGERSQRRSDRQDPRNHRPGLSG